MGLLTSQRIYDPSHSEGQRKEIAQAKIRNVKNLQERLFHLIDSNDCISHELDDDMICTLDSKIDITKLIELLQTMEDAA